MALIRPFIPLVFPSIAYIGNANPGNDSPTVFDDIAIGSGTTNDLIVAGFSWNNGSAPAALTVNGSATGVVNVNALSNGSNPDQARCAMYYFPAPSGTTCDLSLSYAGSAPGGAGVTCGIWRLKKLRSQTPISTDTDTGSPMDWTLNVSRYAVYVAVASFDNDGVGTVTNIIRDYVAGPGVGTHHGGHDQALVANAALAIEMSASSGSQCGIAAAWR